jgi:hypothetical protein
LVAAACRDVDARREMLLARKQPDAPSRARRYGGVQLGPLRFKCILNTARLLPLPLPLPLLLTTLLLLTLPHDGCGSDG